MKPTTPSVANDSWNFDEVVDRSGTWSIKYGRASEGQIPMWIADMDFRTAPAVSSALKERLNRDVLGYTYTPDEFYQSIIHWEKEMHDWQVEKDWVAYCPGVGHRPRFRQPDQIVQLGRGLDDRLPHHPQ